LLAVDGEVRFGCTVVGVAHGDDGVVLTLADGDVIRCEVVAGCDGARSAIAAAMTDLEVVEETPPVRLLAVLGTTPPLEGHTIYAAHPRGYAGQMRRGPDVTRFYLEVPSTDTLADWPENRIRDEVATRLLEPTRLEGVAFIEPSLVDLRMRMTTPIQQGRLFLAGDAAHLVTPAGGKGMNLAIQDAVELAHGLIDCFGVTQDPGRLAGYSATRLPAIWRTQAFSRWMLRMMMSGSDQTGSASETAFGAGLKQGWVSSLQHDPLLAKWFAHAYAGVDPGSE
jgi:p-hydroxybenzoate 3-monooxygenase